MRIRNSSTIRFIHHICLLVLFTGCVSAVPELFPEEIDERSVEIMIVSHGWHVGIIVPVDSLFNELSPPELHALGYKWAEIGWGDRDYYTQESKGIWGAFKGGILPTRSTVHIAAFDETPEIFFSNQDIVKLPLSKEGYKKALEYILETIETDESGKLRVLQDGLYGESRFYASKRIYMIPRTSNGWIARILRKAGLPISPNTSLTAGSVMKKAKSIRHEYSLE